MQGKLSNYDIDIIRPIIGWVEELVGLEYGADATRDVSFQVVADHVRATTFMVADGILPSNVGRGYTLRQILRRGARHGKLLGIENPFMHKCVGLVVDLMKDAYPEIVQAESYAARVILYEEERFSHTLKHGIQILEKEIVLLREADETTLPGTVAFKLHDTYGFPLDLTRDGRMRRETSPSRSLQTTFGPPRSWSPTASCRATWAAATRCARSCVAAPVTANSWA